MSGKNINSVQNILDNLNEKVDIIYKHQTLLSDYSTTPRDYGTGYPMTEVEMHTLGYILDNDGLYASQLAIYTNRTKGAVSQLISKLEAKGLVSRINEPDNKRLYRLYLTKEGHRACEIHRAYDRTRMIEMINEISQYCTIDEIEAFFKVMKYRNVIFERKYEEKRTKKKNLEE